MKKVNTQMVFIPRLPFGRRIMIHLYLLGKIGKVKMLASGTSRWLFGKESAYQCRRQGFNPWAKKIPHAWSN